MERLCVWVGHHNIGVTLWWPYTPRFIMVIENSIAVIELYEFKNAIVYIVVPYIYTNLF